jgi:hypothetical protein
MTKPISLDELGAPLENGIGEGLLPVAIVRSNLFKVFQICDLRWARRSLMLWERIHSRKIFQTIKTYRPAGESGMTSPRSGDPVYYATARRLGDGEPPQVL